MLNATLWERALDALYPPENFNTQVHIGFWLFRAVIVACATNITKNCHPVQSRRHSVFSRPVSLFAFTTLRPDLMDGSGALHAVRSRSTSILSAIVRTGSFPRGKPSHPHFSPQPRYDLARWMFPALFAPLGPHPMLLTGCKSNDD